MGMVLVLVVIGIVAWIEKYHSSTYLRIVQEDEILEWGTMWAFLGAMAFFVFAAHRSRKTDGRFPWFLLGLGVFCLAVAGEEISWGQRVLGYRPPSYFLEHNFQQELNLHNIFAKDLRKLTVGLILLGYGILLPILALFAGPRRLLSRVGIEAPSWALIPAFAVSLQLYESYPWNFTGEVVELTMGLCFLFVALQAYTDRSAVPRGRGFRLAATGTAFLLVILLGWANAAISSGQRSGSPEVAEAATAEIEALRRDFQAMADANHGRVVTKCGLHKRIYSYVEKYGKDELRSGTFASLTAQGLPEDRATFFIDPWNSPYWIRHRCSKRSGKIRVFVYSFGPNRRRDSDRWNIIEDDVGAMIYQRSD